MYLNKAKMIALLNDIEEIAKTSKDKLVNVPGFHPTKEASQMLVKVQSLIEVASPYVETQKETNP
jgi:hypothetical protein